MSDLDLAKPRESLLPPSVGHAAVRFHDALDLLNALRPHALQGHPDSVPFDRAWAVARAVAIEAADAYVEAMHKAGRE